mmetsp:Transcript_1677/g.2277  ORF Transcript_1677/g.2277 Transcript_1677/m.2277 type:complete len:546 (+) Transcript_1677:131-1768(+)
MFERYLRSKGSLAVTIVWLVVLQTVTMKSRVLALVVRNGCKPSFFCHNQVVVRAKATATHTQKLMNIRSTSSYPRYDALFASANKYDIPDFTVEDDDDDYDENENVQRVTFSSEHEEFTPDDYDSDEEDAPVPKPPKSKVIPTRRSSLPPRAPKPPKRKAAVKVTQGTSWMDKNTIGGWAPDQEEEQEQQQQEQQTQQQQPRRDNKKKREQTDGNRTFKDDFRGTRVFVQGIPPQTSWQDLKDHFRVAGEVVFASISVDKRTGESKGCGIVQFETFEEAKTAIQIMRDHPIDGSSLYVREDVQDKPAMPRGGGNTTPPTRWKCANEDNEAHLSVDDRTAILSLIRARDQARRRKNYTASDEMRDELKRDYGVHVDDRLKMWWTSVDGGKTVPNMISDIKGDGGWSGPKPWRQIPTTPENDACVDPNLVEGLLKQRDIARREKDFDTADALLEEARDSPDGHLYLRIHDESRTWRIWTDEKPARPVEHDQESHGEIRKTASEQCIDIVTKYDPAKIDEVRSLLQKFPGREFNILKKLKQRYYNQDP